MVCVKVLSKRSCVLGVLLRSRGRLGDQFEILRGFRRHTQLLAKFFGSFDHLFRSDETAFETSPYRRRTVTSRSRVADAAIRSQSFACAGKRTTCPSPLKFLPTRGRCRPGLSAVRTTDPGSNLVSPAYSSVSFLALKSL